ncbi:hypothetical protein SAMN05421870_10886 [Streptomyces qinglanensis]|uniref:Uncharacterized protein n=1 Tax=Streptomyces qinglanensis TaxID=943816 RepID=A0A1H9UD98_9ACTN|nr:hypothetical protein SAMN05421870_10886 [Streptomyces qinglanensis]
MRTDPFREPDRRTQQSPGAGGTRPRPSASPSDARRNGVGHLPALHSPGNAPDASAVEAGRSTPVSPAEPRPAAATLCAQRSGRPPDAFFLRFGPTATRRDRAAQAADAPGLRPLARAGAVHSTAGDGAGRTPISNRVH